MKLNQNHIEQIRSDFATIETKKDLVKLLNIANNLMYGQECKPFRLKSLTYYANPELCKRRYQTFVLKKKSGKERIINAPNKGLKSILRALNYVMHCLYEPHPSVTGFTKDKSIVDNAKVHVGQFYVYNLDLKDFFHGFDRKWVKYGFSSQPFNLSGSPEKEEIAFLLACLCTHPFEINGEVRTVLPQGSPTSPSITNILCAKLDRRLTGLAKRFGANYTRYADDITFSAPINFVVKKDFQDELFRIIQDDQKLIINPDKTRLQKAGYKQEVTGLLVNEKVNVHRRYIKQIRMWIYYWEKYGYDKALQLFRRDYKLDKGHVKHGTPSLANVLDGKLEYLKMVKGMEDTTYKGLKDRFDLLVGIQDPINDVLSVWEKEGIDQAMKKFYAI
jgi:RNA-directed DNA polymerase